MRKEDVLAGIPADLRDELVHEFNKISRNYREHRWESTALDGGRLCEIVFTILKGHMENNFPSKPSKPANMVDSCRDLEKLDSTRFSRSMRIQIPRMLICLYEIRNNRGVGHVGGDVDSNQMDSEVVFGISKWLIAELIRIFHGISTEEASKSIELIIERTIPVVWPVGNERRVLNKDLPKKNQVLILLYSTHSVQESELRNWVEYKNATTFRESVLQGLHNDRLIEYNPKSRIVTISPLGTKFVEQNLTEYLTT